MARRPPMESASSSILYFYAIKLLVTGICYPRKIRPLYLLFAGLMISLSSPAQRYSLVIKGGRVIDPANNIDSTLDIAIEGGKVVLLQSNIPTSLAAHVIKANGRYVVPGLVDLHTHVFFGDKNGNNLCDGHSSIIPDRFSFQSGVTTVVDAGSSGWRNFRVFDNQIIKKSKTRVLAFLNIVGHGMRGAEYEQDTLDMDPDSALHIARLFPGVIVGFKVAHFNCPSWYPVEHALKAGEVAHLPVMVDFGSSTPKLSLQTLLLEELRRGDIFTHCYARLEKRESIVDDRTGQIKPFVMTAKHNGIDFDVGRGKISFNLKEAGSAAQSRFFPGSISTDMQEALYGEADGNMLAIMSIFMALGMKMSDIIAASSTTPARIVGHQEIGQLAPGCAADIAILDMHNVSRVYFDTGGNKITCPAWLSCSMTIREGNIVYADPHQ